MAIDLDERRRARQALHRADALLGEIEELQLGGHSDVPPTCRDSATEVFLAAANAGLRDPRLTTDAGVIKLMDDVFTLEQRLMRRLRRRTHRARISQRPLPHLGSQGSRSAAT